MKLMNEKILIVSCACIIGLCVVSGIKKLHNQQNNIPKAIPVPEVVLVKPKRIPTEISAWNEMVSMVKHFEGFYGKSYTCPAGFKTIGYGFTEKKFLSKGSISEKESSNILESKLRSAEKDVERIVKVPLTPYQKCALVSFTYNCEVHNLTKLVSGPKRLNGGNYNSVAKLLPLYNKGGGKTLKGLTKRRAQEVLMWNKR